MNNTREIILMTDLFKISERYIQHYLILKLVFINTYKV